MDTRFNSWCHMANISLLSIWVIMLMEGVNTIIVLQTRTDVQSSGFRAWSLASRFFSWLLAWRWCYHHQCYFCMGLWHLVSFCFCFFGWGAILSPFCTCTFHNSSRFWFGLVVVLKLRPRFVGSIESFATLVVGFVRIMFSGSYCAIFHH